MDWGTIIVAVISALGGGGLAVLFTRKETKEGMSLDNMQKVLDAKDRIIEEREARCKELKEDLTKKDDKIDELHRINSTLRHKLDDANTKAAVAEVMRCDITKCTTRRPPFGSHVKVSNEGLIQEEDK